jgi:hypothetical protein
MESISLISSNGFLSATIIETPRSQCLKYLPCRYFHYPPGGLACSAVHSSGTSSGLAIHEGLLLDLCRLQPEA